MPFKDGVMDGVVFRKARWTGRKITPEIVVLHDTASRLGKGVAARDLADNDRKVSVHFVVERNGHIQQQVPVNKRANHAGKSNYHGRNNCNDFSVGIELVNPGRMQSRGVDAIAWYGERFNVHEYGIQNMTTPQHGSGSWMPYTDSQIEAVIKLLRTLFLSFDTLTDITTHWYISPGRKSDTNPLFPLAQIRAQILGRDDPLDEHADDNSEAEPAGHFVQIYTPNDTLNLRRWPSFHNPNVLAKIPHKTVLPVLREGTFDGRAWLCVHYGGQEGWIVAAYTETTF